MPLVPWALVAYAPNRIEVEAALLEEGYVLTHNYMGSYYCLPHHIVHPDYAKSAHYEAEIRARDERKNEGKRLCAMVNSAMNEVQPPNMPLLIARYVMQQEFVQEAEIQSALTSFWAEFWNDDFATFQKFCEKFRRTPQPTHGPMIPYHEVWAEKRANDMLATRELETKAREAKERIARESRAPQGVPYDKYGRRI